MGGERKEEGRKEQETEGGKRESTHVSNSFYLGAEKKMPTFGARLIFF